MHSSSPAPTPGTCELCHKAREVLLSEAGGVSELSGDCAPLCASCRERTGAQVRERGCDNCGARGELEALVVPVARAGERIITRTWMVCGLCASSPERIRAKRKHVPWAGGESAVP